MSSLTQDEPDLVLAGLRIWIHGWQFPNIDEYWDANWLYCTARCAASGAHVEATDSFLRVPELASWLDHCEKLAKSLKGKVVLEPMEPTLHVEIIAQSLGHMQVQVQLTPDNLAQKHWFEFNVDQTHIVQLISQLKVVLQEHPVRGHR